ncbi:MAG: shikimate dehydrogenase [Thiohalospira sp.]
MSKDPFDFSPEPDRYAVMGDPVDHSLSPRIHTLFAEQTGQQLTYEAIRVDQGGLAQALGNFGAAGGRGANITVPLKERAYALADELSDRARLAGAVNTLTLDGDRLAGDNTDGAGLVADLTENLGWPLAGSSILLVGAGGAARGVIAPLLEAGPARLLVVNRTPDRARELADHFRHLGPVEGGGLPAAQGPFDIIINATAASLAAEVPDLPAEAVGEQTWVYDMMYGAEPTAFLGWAAGRGAAELADGLGMLVGQAAESFRIWRGVRPDAAAVLETLRRELLSAG